MQSIDINNIPLSKVFHFIGIDGIGMSAIAGVLLNKGFKVQGSNDTEGDNLENLKRNGATIFIGHNKDNINNADYVIYSSAIPEDNPELKEAKTRNIPIIERAVMLANLLQTGISIAVTGTHGKTTTTSFIGTLLDIAKLSPTIINGGIINKYNSHYKVGNGKYIVAEACEAFGNISHYTADIGIITNIDPEHLEYYKTFDNLKKYFKEFINRIPTSGTLIACADNKTSLELANNTKNKTVITYGIENNAMITAKNINFDETGSYFDIYKNNELYIKNAHIPLLGKHNILNTLAAVSVAIHLNINKDNITSALNEFYGNKHRFTKVTEVNNIKIYDDYAHHPNEIKSTLEMARLVAKENKILSIFQPHRYSRLSLLFNDFLNCFNETDYLVIMPVYGAGENKDNYKDSNDFFNEIKSKFQDKLFIINSFNEITPIIKENLKTNDLIISFGAGSIKHYIYELPKLLQEK